MKVKVSKVFANFINKTAKELNIKVTAKVVEYSQNEYKWNVDYNLFRAYDYGDYNIENGKYKAIMLLYPEEYYATPKFLTTCELTKEFHRMKVQTVAELQSMIKAMCEI